MTRRTLATLAAALAVMAVAGCARELAWRGQLEAAGIRFISARTLKAMMERGDRFVLVDARDEPWYQAGHLPGAISIPAEEAPLAAVAICRPKAVWHPERLPGDRGRLLVFYCGGPT